MMRRHVRTVFGVLQEQLAGLVASEETGRGTAFRLAFRGLRTKLVMIRALGSLGVLHFIGADGET